MNVMVTIIENLFIASGVNDTHSYPHFLWVTI